MGGTTEDPHSRVRNVSFYGRLWRIIKSQASKSVDPWEVQKQLWRHGLQEEWERTVHGGESGQNQGEKKPDLLQYLLKASLHSTLVTLKP